MAGKDKPQKIAEIKLSIYDDATVAGDFVVIHRYPELGTKKELMPKEEFAAFLQETVPVINLDTLISDLSSTSIMAMVTY